MRLITHLVTDSRDPEPLTPSQLLYGRRLGCLPYLQDDNYNQRPTDELSHPNLYKHALKQRELLHNFRSQWKGEY